MKMKEYKLKDLILEKITGEWGDDPTNTDEGTFVLRTTNFTNLGVLDFNNVVKRVIDEKKIEKKKLKLNDIIIEKSGGSPTQPVGRVVFFEQKIGIFLCNNFTTILRSNDIVYSKYLFYMLHYNHKIGKTLKFQNRTTGIINLKLEKYLNTIIQISENLDDQIRISDLLSQMESLITKREESIRLLDELLKSTFLDLFGDPVLNSKEWEKFPLKKFGNIITGNTPSRVQKEFYNNQYIEWIKTDNIFPDEMYISNSKEYLSKEGLKKGRYLKSGSLLVTCIAGSIKSIGTAALSDRPVAFNQQMNAIEPNDKVNSFYLYWLFKIGKKYFQDQAGKGMKKIITKSTFEKIVFPLPPKALQDKFAIIVQQVEQSKSAYQLSLKQLNNLFASLSQQAFSGELELSKLKIDKSENNNVIVDQPENYNVLIEQNTTQDFSVWNDIAKPVLDGLVLGAVIGAAYNLLTPKKEIENNSNANDNVIKPQDFDEVYEAVARPISNTLEDGTTVSGFQIDEDALFSLIKAASKNGATFEDVQMQLQGKGHSIPYDEDTDKRITGLTLKESVFKLLKSNELVQEFDEDKKQIVLKSLQ